jgi:glutamine synthetase
MVDNTDRNRTSPFAFTGNRFEFRAVGSEANCASGMIALNTAVAEALTDFKKRVDALIKKGSTKESAILEVLRADIKTCKPIRFDGNGYSDEWQAEAKKRGLDCESSCPVIFDQYLAPASVKMFEDMKVMVKKELEARNEIKWETYTKKVQIEARVFGDLSLNHIVPMATKYQSALIDNVLKLRQIFPADKAAKMSESNMALIEQISEHTNYISENVKKLVENRKVANKLTDPRAMAVAYHDTVAPMMEDIRKHIDKLEEIVEDEIWTLPKYREMLFIR